MGLIIIFNQHGQPEQGRQSGAAPRLSTASKSALKLFSQRLNGSASHGCSCFFHLLIMQMVTMILDVADFATNRLLIFFGPFMLRFQELLQSVDDLALFAVSKPMQY